MFIWTRYRRFWAVWRDTNLVCVTVYRRGAVEAARLLNEFAGATEIDENENHICDDDCRSYGCKWRWR